MRRLSDTDTRLGGVEDDGDLVPSRHQPDVSHVGNVPAATESQADVRWVATSQAREIREMMPEQLGEPYPLHGAPACVVDHVGLDIRPLSALSRWGDARYLRIP
jgi:hypothetical protein